MKTIAAEIRYAHPADARPLADVHAVAWLDAYRGIIPHRTLTRMIERRGESWWSQAIGNRSAILVMEFGGEPVGYATVGRNRTSALAVEGEIYELYLKPEFRGLGFGRRLFDAGRKLLRSRGLRGVAVWALSDNAMANEFYAAMEGVDIASGSEVFEDRTVGKIAYIWA